MRAAVWIGIWVVLLAGSGFYLWRALRRFWTRASRFGEQLGQSSAVLEQLRLELEARQPSDADASQLDGAPPRTAAAPWQPAVFDSPLTALDRYRRVRSDVSGYRRRRRIQRRPPWART